MDIRLECLSVFFSRNIFLIQTSAFDEAVVRQEEDANRRFSHWETLHGAANTAFEARQTYWASSLKKWVDRIGPIGTSQLQRLELEGGVWHLHKPAK
jgi:hypothetical protein